VQRGAIGRVQEAEVDTSGEPPVARARSSRSGGTREANFGQSYGGAAVVGLVLRCALNAPPFGLRRLRSGEEGQIKLPNPTKVRRTEQQKGTFLKS